jgi:hypothetical protein
MNVSIKTLNCLNVMQNNLLRYLLQLGKHNHLSSIQQALKILSFKHLYYKYKLGFRQQLESYSLSKEIFYYIIKQDSKLIKSSSYACNVNNLSNILEVDINDFGVKNKLDSQLKGLNEKFNKKPEMVEIVKFCLDNFNLQEHRENLKVITRYENQEVLSMDGFA